MIDSPLWNVLCFPLNGSLSTSEAVRQEACRVFELPVCPLQLEDLKWEVEQKEREFQALKQQLDLTEQRSQKELEGVQLVLQVFLLSPTDVSPPRQVIVRELKRQNRIPSE